MCAEANFFHNGFDRIDGIFFDTGSTRRVFEWLLALIQSKEGIFLGSVANWRALNLKPYQGSEKFWPGSC